MKKLYVGNLSYQTREEELESLFGQYGNVKSVKIITDRASGQSKGFGFVEFDDDGEADAAVDALDGSDVGGRNIRVNEARDRQEGGGGGGGGFRGARRSGGGGGGAGFRGGNR